MKTSKIPKNNFRRGLNWGWRQKAKTKVCPATPRLDNKIVVITGGNAGVGLETVKGLLVRGAEVIFLSRNEKKSKAVSTNPLIRNQSIKSTRKNIQSNTKNTTNNHEKKVVNIPQTKKH